MSAYLNKAHNNVATAEFLLDNGLPLTSAHPAYYSAFLLMKHVLAHFCSQSYERQDEISKNKDSHKVISNLALPYMARWDSETGNDYLVWYNKLKMMRNKADYKPEDIEDSLLRSNLDVAKNFIKNAESYIITANK